MTRIGLSECTVLLAFWIAGLAAFFVGGLPLVGHVVQVFLAVAFLWVCRDLYREYYELLKTEHYKTQIFADWQKRQNSHLKGMD